MQYLLLFHCIIDCKNAPACYVIRTLPVLFNTPWDWWEKCLTVVGHVLWPQRGGSCRGCRLSVDEFLSFGNIMALQVIICFRLSLHFCKLTTIRATQDPVRVHDCEKPLHQINFCYCACNYTRWFKYDRGWFVCKQAALSSSCATLREWSHNLHPPSCSG